MAVGIEAADRYVPLFSTQMSELMKSIFKRSIAELEAVMLCFPFCLALQKLLEGVFWKAGSQRFEQPQGKSPASIGKSFASSFGEEPAIARPSGAAGARAGRNESFLGQSAEMTAHRLH